jgi:outer membrane protein
VRRIILVAALASLVSAPLFAQTPQTVRHLSLKEAEDEAVQNHPQVLAAQNAARAATESVRQAKSAYYPTILGSFTGADAQSGTRIAAGGLNNPTILERFAYGFAATQMLTDFGRTSALTASAAAHADSQADDVVVRRANVMLEVDRAYFGALRAQAIRRVADQTVTARQIAVDQIAAMQTAGLKSSLDLSFARVNLGEAQLLQVQAKDEEQAAYATLSAAMAVRQVVTYDLADEPMPPAPEPDSAPLIAQALHDRPDVARQRAAQLSQQRFADAERALWFPTVSVIGAAGLTPYHQIGLTDQYSAVGVNVQVPLANGGLFSARKAGARFIANAADQDLEDLQNRVTRDVQLAWLQEHTAFQRLDLTNQLLTEASDALDLAQQRYTLGLSSIVELTQAQLNQTEAQIQQTTARYDYQAVHSSVLYQIGALK